MCVKEWKRIAEWEAMHYRERKAFLRGVEDAGGSAAVGRAAQFQKWVLAVERVQKHLDRHDAEKARFFRLYYGLDGGQKASGKKGMVAMTFTFHAAQSTLYQWKNEVLSLLMIAAAQTGALQPFTDDHR